MLFIFFVSSRRRHTRCALVTGVQTCALPISEHTAMRAESLRSRHAALMSVDQARHRQRTVEAVLGVVVPGVAAGIAGQGARVQAAEGLERVAQRSEEHTSELQSLMRRAYAVFRFKNNRTRRDTLHISLH